MEDDWEYNYVAKQDLDFSEVESKALEMLLGLGDSKEQCNITRTVSEELSGYSDESAVLTPREKSKHKTIEQYEALENKSGSEICSVSPSADTLLSEETYQEEDINSSKIIENQKTPHSDRHKIKNRLTSYSDHIINSSTSVGRFTPLPILNFANSEEVWQNMVYKEEATSKTRNSKLFADRSSYLPRMRAILLDWIMEVCEVYHLRRNTYYLSVDYIDRFLTIKPTVPKTQLQLLGVSCLFVASKLEEIYPPKLTEFSYVCDGACTEADILSCEILLLNTLVWDINPMTPTNWLNLYMQIHYNSENLKKQRLHEGVSHNFQFPQYSAYQFVRASHLIDLFSMDPGFLRFSYSVIAAAAIYYIFGKTIALAVSGFVWEQVEVCVEYMSVFNQVIKESSDPRLQCVISQNSDDKQHTATFRSLKANIPNLVQDENHCMQTHLVDLEYFEKATMLRLKQIGIRVEKTMVKKKKVTAKAPATASSESEQQDEVNIDQNSEVQEEETTHVVYELEKILDAEIEKYQELLIIGELSEDSDVNGASDRESHLNNDVDGVVNILKIEKKTKLSFDDILSSIHNDYYDVKYRYCV